MGKKGVTLVEIVIVVIILVLLALIAIWSSERPSLQAEVAEVFSEIKAVRTGVIKIKNEYDAEVFEDYKIGEHYNAQVIDGAGNPIENWYEIYGINHPNYNENVTDGLGIEDLKRNYKVNFKTLEVEFLDGPVKLGDYELSSYEDFVVLMDSGVI